MNTSKRYLTLAVAFLLMGLSLVLAVTLTAPRVARAAPAVLYAAPDGVGDCSSWANACTLQTALAQATSGDEIWVEAGVHYPGAARADTFTLENGVALYGGFAATETLRTQRNWLANVTVLSGDIVGDDTNTDGNFIAETAADIQGDNAYHVVTGATGATLDGFVITAGQANGIEVNDCGGGMYNNESSPTLANVAFSGNTAVFGGGMCNRQSSDPTLTNVTFSDNTAIEGGGMYNEDSSPTLTDVIFSGNYAIEGGGGGMYNTSSSPTLTNVTFSDNTAVYAGGGMFNYSSDPTLTDVTFSGNTAVYAGGGMYNDSSSPTLTNVIFSGNTAGSNGGGMYNYDSNPTLTNVIFSGNSANDYGGGMYNYSSSPALTNVTFSGNSADFGGGMYNWDNSPTLTNVTFSGNSATGGGGMFNSSSSPELTNVILWGNSALTGPEIYNIELTAVISYSIVQGCGGSGSWDSDCGSDGGSNIDDDPLFVDAAGGNLRLDFGSPAIDTGTNTGCPTTDLDGLPRPTDGDGDTIATCDMGAYEAGTMLCDDVTEGSPYIFGDQSDVSIEIITLGNLFCLYVDEMGLNHPNATSGIQTGRYWLIHGLTHDKEEATGFTVNLTLPHDDLANPQVCKYPGGLGGYGWDCQRSGFNASEVWREGITAFSDWAVGNNVGPTAVGLRHLTAHPAATALLPGLAGMALLALAGWAVRRKPHPGP